MLSSVPVAPRFFAGEVPDAELQRQVAELERHLAVSKATRPEVASLVQMARAARSERERLDAA